MRRTVLSDDVVVRAILFRARGLMRISTRRNPRHGRALQHAGASQVSVPETSDLGTTVGLA